MAIEIENGFYRPFFILAMMELRSLRFSPKRIIEQIVETIEMAITIIVRRMLSSNIECKSNGIEIENANTAKIGSATFLKYDDSLSCFTKWQVFNKVSIIIMHIIAMYIIKAKLGFNSHAKARYIIGSVRRYIEPMPMLRNSMRPVA